MAGLDAGEDTSDGSTVSIEQLSLDGGVVTLRVRGQLDVETGPQLDQHLLDATAAGGERIVLDFADVDFMDSSGIAVLLAAAGRATRIELKNPSHAVRRVISIAGLADVLPMSPDA